MLQFFEDGEKSLWENLCNVELCPANIEEFMNTFELKQLYWKF